MDLSDDDDDLFAGEDLAALEDSALAAWDSTQAVTQPTEPVPSRTEKDHVAWPRDNTGRPFSAPQSARQNTEPVNTANTVESIDQPVRFKELEAKLQKIGAENERLLKEQNELKQQSYLNSGEASMMRTKLSHLEQARIKEAQEWSQKLSDQQLKNNEALQKLQNELENHKVHAEFANFDRFKAKAFKSTVNTPVATPKASKTKGGINGAFDTGFGKENGLYAPGTPRNKRKADHPPLLSRPGNANLSQQLGANEPQSKNRYDLDLSVKLEILSRLLSCSPDENETLLGRMSAWSPQGHSAFINLNRVLLQDLETITVAMYAKALQDVLTEELVRVSDSKELVLISCLCSLIQELVVILSVSSDLPLDKRFLSIANELVTSLLADYSQNSAQPECEECLVSVIGTLVTVSEAASASSRNYQCSIMSPGTLKLCLDVQARAWIVKPCLIILQNSTSASSVGPAASGDDDFGMTMNLILDRCCQILLDQGWQRFPEVHEEIYRLLARISLDFGLRDSASAAQSQETRDGPNILRDSAVVIPTLLSKLTQSLNALLKANTDALGRKYHASQIKYSVQILFIISSEDFAPVLRSFPGGIYHVYIASMTRLSFGDDEYDALAQHIEGAQEIVQLATDLLERTVSVDEGDMIYDLFNT